MGTRLLTVNDILAGYVTLDIECLDRIYLNGYVPDLPQLAYAQFPAPTTRRVESWNPARGPSAQGALRYPTSTARTGMLTYVSAKNVLGPGGTPSQPRRSSSLQTSSR